MPIGFIQLPADSTGKKVWTWDFGANGHAHYVIPTEDRVISFRGRASSFRIPGRAGTAGQKLATIHNATGSTVLVDVQKVSVDFVATVVKAVTVLPPVLRLYRFTVLPTGGAAIVKVNNDTAQSSSTSLTLLQDASADGASAATQLAATLTGNAVTQIFAPRLITAAGYEMVDRIEFMDGNDEFVTLRAGEGLAVQLDYTLATQNPVTDFYTVNFKWVEFTKA